MAEKSADFTSTLDGLLVRDYQWNWTALFARRKQAKQSIYGSRNYFLKFPTLVWRQINNPMFILR